MKPLSNMKNSIHYIEHLMISPDNKRFAFLHRWTIGDGGIYSRLYTSNIDGSDIYLLNDSGRMSHFYWKGNNHLLAWGGIENSINKMRKYKNIIRFFIKPLLPLYHQFFRNISSIRNIATGDSYLIFQDKTKNVEKINTDILKEDGHPSFSCNKNLFISDTYPNAKGVSELFLFDIKYDKKILIDKLNSIKKLNNSASRCDLHPKWSLDGKYVSIDTTDQGYRSMYIYKIKDIY